MIAPARWGVLSIVGAVALSASLSCVSAERRAFIEIGTLEVEYLTIQTEYEAWKVGRDVDPERAMAVYQAAGQVFRAQEVIGKAKAKGHVDARSLAPAVTAMRNGVAAYRKAAQEACSCLR